MIPPGERPLNPDQFAQGDLVYTPLTALAQDMKTFSSQPNQLYVAGSLALAGETVPLYLPRLGEGHTELPGGDEAIRQQSASTARSLVLSMLQSVEPGQAKVWVYDSCLTNEFDDFYELGPKLFEKVDPHALRTFLGDLTSHVASLGRHKKQVGELLNPWRIAIIMDDGSMKSEHVEEINRLVAAGPGFGSIVTIGVPGLRPNKWLAQEWWRTPDIRVPAQYHPGLPRSAVGRACLDIAKQANKEPEGLPLSLILPDKPWTRSAKYGIEVPVGIGEDGKPFYITLGSNENTHMLVTGPTGSGKSNFLRSMLTAVAWNHPPSEVQMIVTDYKHAADYGRLVSGSQNDYSYLPNALLVARHVERDPEFGLTILKYLLEEKERRARRGEEVDASDYVELRDKDPDGEWPRLFVLSDEFQVLLAHNPEAAVLLDEIGRQGRAFGIHLVLGTQSVGGIDMQERQSVFANFKWRVAMPGGDLLDGEHLNRSPIGLPTHHAVVNWNAGNRDDETIVEVVKASPDAMISYQKQLYVRRPGNSAPPHIFDGQRVPKLKSAPGFKELAVAPLAPKVLVGDEPSVKPCSAGFTLSRFPGRNLAAVGPREEETRNVLHTAALSLAKQVPDARMSIVYLDPQAAPAIDRLVADLGDHGYAVKPVHPHAAARFFSEVHQELSPEAPNSHFVFVYNADARLATMTSPSTLRHEIDLNGLELKIETGRNVLAGTTLIASNKDGSQKLRAPVAGDIEIDDTGKVFIKQIGPSGQDHLREILDKGPESGVHVFASFSTPDRLKELISHRGTVNAESIGVLVAAGVSPDELTRFTPGELPGRHSLARLNRKNRVIFFDRAAMVPPRIIVPYNVTT